MSTYIKPFMTEELSHHELMRPNPYHFILRRPDTCNYLLNIFFIANRIVLTGDLTIGGRNGCVSDTGYDLAWFGSRKSEGYLCSKFLSEVWQWEAAEETLRDWLTDPTWENFVEPDHRAELQNIVDWQKGSGFCWDYDVPTQHELYEALMELGQGYADDGPPGMDYPRDDAGWLCAVQKRFVELYGEMIQQEDNDSA